MQKWRMLVGFFLQHMETKFRGVGSFTNMEVNSMLLYNLFLPYSVLFLILVKYGRGGRHGPLGPPASTTPVIIVTCRHSVCQNVNLVYRPQSLTLVSKKTVKKLMTSKFFLYWISKIWTICSVYHCIDFLLLLYYICLLFILVLSLPSELFLFLFNFCNP